MLLDGDFKNKQISFNNRFEADGITFEAFMIRKLVPIKLTDVRTSLTHIAPIIETFLPRLLGFDLLALEPFRDRAYNLTIAKFTPHSSMNIKSFKQTPRIFCQNSYSRL